MAHKSVKEISQKCLELELQLLATEEALKLASNVNVKHHLHFEILKINLTLIALKWVLNK